MRDAVDVEVCIDSASEDSVRAAASAAIDGGAATIELCAAMHLQGLTPPPAHVAIARNAFPRPGGVFVMIRPRAGDFLYSRSEVHAMAEQVRLAAAAGADGAVFGVLREGDATVCRWAIRRLVETAAVCGLRTTFHRAFDAVADRTDALSALIDLGVDRVLTSGVAWGQAGTALDGIARIRDTVEQADGRIEVVIGGGVCTENLSRILAGLPSINGVSVHAYSGVHYGGVTTVDAVRSFVEAARMCRPS